MNAIPTDIARLCAECGMCCNGSLFHSVVLQPGDSARTLSALGLKTKQKKGREFFLQPCPAHRDSACAIYGQRPIRCRLFHCQLLLRIWRGEMTTACALEKILEARDRVTLVNRLIDQVAETNPNRALSQRCANALTTSAWTPVHDELQSSMQSLEKLLENDFRISDAPVEQGSNPAGQ